ncbi:unnamed protein product [Clonostachys byssicola]|uniref:Uncharacterized protein n=1 Tax=Clonostachys byssicola TaxID=160290 RepID=A0A9N9Y875_9HYPO|nr:unnamed protein product [Clonostachys byssicola]
MFFSQPDYKINTLWV